MQNTAAGLGIAKTLVFKEKRINISPKTLVSSVNGLFFTLKLYQIFLVGREDF